MKGKLLIVLLSTIFIFSACKAADEEYDEEKIRDLEYTIVEDEDLPEVVLSRIESEKSESFRFSYTNGQYTYIAIGYGEQPTGGYSIQLDALYETNEYLVVKTKLIGPSENEIVITSLTYPYIVIKTEDLELPICYR